MVAQFSTGILAHFSISIYMLGTVKPSGVIFFGTKGEDRNSFISIHRNKFAVQKQRVSDGAMKKHTRGGRKQGKGKNGNKKK